MGSLLLYGFRVFERQAGTEAYGSRVVFVGVLSALLQLGLGAALREPHGFASGPYGVVFAMFVPFCLDVPATSRFTFLGLALTDKAFTYALGLQLLLLHGRLSALAGLCGLAAGALVRLDVLGLRRLRLPRWFSGLVARTLGAILGGGGGAAPKIRRGNVGGVQGQEWGGAAAAVAPGGGARGGGRRQLAVVEPSPEALEQLVAMGFQPNQAAEALRQANNDVTVATNILLGAGQ